MIFNVQVKTDEEPHKVGDLVYHKRKLLRVERVTKPRGPQQMIRVKFRIVGKVNLDRELRSDRGFLADSERERLIAIDWGKDAAKVRTRTEWLLGWGRGYDARADGGQRR